MTAAGYESGMDDSPMYEDVAFNREKNTMELQDVGLNSLYIADCLALAEMASILGRDAQGRPLANPPLLEALAYDPILGKCKLIAEAWDAGGLYQVGSFVGDRWAVWNGRYRDTVRRFVKSDTGTVSDLADAVSGSFNVFSQLDRDPMRSVNFITAHDGFTLNDLVSYNEKHNQANGEDNRDGNDQNDSWNCGVEGPTDDPQVEALRQRLHTYRTQLAWPAPEKTRVLFEDLFHLLADFGRFHPEFYGPIRDELVSWAMHDSDPALAARASATRAKTVSTSVRNRSRASVEETCSSRVWRSATGRDGSRDQTASRIRPESDTPTSFRRTRRVKRPSRSSRRATWPEIISWPCTTPPAVPNGTARQCVNS